MYLSGRGIRTRGPRGERIVDDSFLLLFHAGDLDQTFVLPGPPWGDSYVVEVDTAHPALITRERTPAGVELPMTARSAVVLRAVRQIAV